MGTETCTGSSISVGSRPRAPDTNPAGPNNAAPPVQRRRARSVPASGKNTRPRTRCRSTGCVQLSSLQLDRDDRLLTFTLDQQRCIVAGALDRRLEAGNRVDLGAV